MLSGVLEKLITAYSRDIAGLIEEILSCVLVCTKSVQYQCLETQAQHFETPRSLKFKQKLNYLWLHK